MTDYKLVPADLADLIKRLRIKAGVMEMGELVAWGSDTALMREAADALEMLAAPAVQGEPVAYAVFEDNGNIRIWCADPVQVETLRQQYGEALQPLYTAPQPAPDVKALVEALEDAFCIWHNDPETDNSWDTGCRQLFELYDGTPSENHMSFCCYCGKPIQEDIDRARRDEGEGE